MRLTRRQAGKMSLPCNDSIASALAGCCTPISDQDPASHGGCSSACDPVLRWTLLEASDEKARRLLRFE